MNLPNKITLTRICMIPLFAAVFYLDVIPYNYLIAAVIFLVAALTDALDGHIARSRHLVTNLGKFLDPIADKVLVATALILLLTRPVAFLAVGEWGLIVGGVLVALILARELIVSGFRMIAAEQDVVLAADKLGKIKTVTQDIAIALLLGAMSFLTTEVGTVVAYIGLAFFAVCAILTVVSGINYIIKDSRVLKTEEKKVEKGAANEKENVLDEDYYAALALLITYGSASISLLQRKLFIGYNRAGEIMSWMEKNGYVTEYNSAAPREILITKEEFRDLYKKTFQKEWVDQKEEKAQAPVGAPIVKDEPFAYENEVDERYYKALLVMAEYQSASIALVQRKCALGYALAGKIIDWMEYNGYVSAFDGSKARNVLISLDEAKRIYEEYQSQQ